ncbi:hypothetical protein RJ55_08201 [Drechmeria coniospora]|nr:hypothetical protein RJ55_08201 [Drechmeria coniospora]
MAYSLVTSYVGESLLSGFNWIDYPDPSHGYVSYQNRPNAEALGLFSVDETTGVVRLGVDHNRTYGLNEGRPSIRLESKEAYNSGLFIADFLHMPPSQCGLWPAFWAYGTNWPHGGEIDIIEGANTAHQNLISAHTADGCTVEAGVEAMSAGRLLSQECAVGTLNVGCGYVPPADDGTTYGDGFNAAGGGVYAMLWDDSYIKVWHFARNEIPSDIHAKDPTPEKWKRPDAVFGGASCQPDSFFKDMSIVININFCGDWGNAVWGKSDTCNEYAPTCPEYVANNPSAFSNAYWDVQYIEAYQFSAVPLTESTTTPTGSTTTTVSESKKTTMSEPKTTSDEPTTTSTITVTSTKTKTITASASATGTSSAVVTGSATGSAAEPSSSPANPAQVNGFASLGCFGSTTGFSTFRQALDSADMAIEKCVDACKLTSSTFAGLFNRTCYCADTLDAGTRARSADESGGCTIPCPGDSDEFCGGLADARSSNMTSLNMLRSRRAHLARRAISSGHLLTMYRAVAKNETRPHVPPPMAPNNRVKLTGADKLAATAVRAKLPLHTGSAKTGKGTGSKIKSVKLSGTSVVAIELHGDKDCDCEADKTRTRAHKQTKPTAGSKQGAGSKSTALVVAPSPAEVNKAALVPAVVKNSKVLASEPCETAVVGRAINGTTNRNSTVKQPAVVLAGAKSIHGSSLALAAASFGAAALALIVLL